MAPINEMHAAQDEVSDWAVQHQQARFSPIGTSIPDPRPPVRHVPSFTLTHSAQGSPSITDADCAAVLDALVESGELDDERADLMLRLAASKRLSEQKIVPTPNGKWAGIAVDACSHLIELQKLIGELDFFSAGDTGLGRLQQASERVNALLQRAGYRNGNAEVSHG